MLENAFENASEILSATQDKGKRSKTTPSLKKEVPDYSPEPEHDAEERKSSFHSDLSSAN